MAEKKSDYATADALDKEADELIEKYKEALKNPQGNQGATDNAGTRQDTPANSQAGPNEDTQRQPPDSSAAGDATANEQTRAETPSYEEALRKAEERVKNAQARMTKATQEAADLRRRLAEVERQLAEKTKEPASPELEKASEDYPDIVKPLLGKIAELEERLLAQGQKVAETSEQAAREAHFAAIAKVHPDHLEIGGTEEFDEWLATQTPVWQKVAAQGTAADVIDLITRFKDQTKKPALQGADKAREAADPPLRREPSQPNSGKKTWTRAEIESLSVKEFERLEEEIDKAYAEGRVR